MTTTSKRAAGLTIAWMVVAAAMATFAWQAVSAAGTRVNQQPLYPLSAGVPALEPDPTEDIVVVPLETSSSISTSSSTTLPDGITSSTAGATGTGTSAPSATATSSATSTTSTPTSTTGTTGVTTTSTPSTTASVAMQRASYTLIGGTITIEYGNGDVVLISAVPKAGFATDIDSSGPSEVDVDFRSESHRSKFDAAMSSGQLVVNTEEKVDD